MKGFLIGVGMIIILLIIGFSFWANFTIGGKTFFRDWRTDLKEVEEQAYENKVKVEDEARIRIVAYTNARNEYFDLKEQCESTESSLTCERSYAKKTSVNNLATQYNEFMLKNSHVWEENIPSDIDSNLLLLQ